MSKPVVRVRAGDLVGASARPVASAAPRSAYTAGDPGHPAMAGWMPPLRSADADWLGERDISTARLRDLERNDGWVRAGISRKVDMLVGASLRLNPQPDHVALGISFEEAHAFGAQIQSKWREWANDPTFRCDAERQLTFSGAAALVAREFVGTPGESLVVLRWIENATWPYRTALHVIDPDRLSNPNGEPDSDLLRRGVVKDANNAPIGYHIRKGHPSDVFGISNDAFTWEYVPRWDHLGGWDRPKVLHVYDKQRPGQSRGVSDFVAGISKAVGLKRYSESELRAAAINSSIIGALYTQMGADYVADRMGGGDVNQTDWGEFNQQRADFYSNRTVLDGERFLTLFPSDRMDLNTTPRQTSGFANFQTAFLQAFAASIGISYEQLSMDWSKTNYSSARAALNEVWRSIQRLRGVLVSTFAMPAYTAWFEDALDSGELETPDGAPDFYEAPAAYLRSEWIGPGRGWVDPVKEAQAATLRQQAQTSTLEREAAEQGLDWEDVLDQQRREQLAREERGLPAPGTDMSTVARSDMDDRRPVDN